MSASKHRGRSYTAPTGERFGTTMRLRRFVHLVALITTGLLTLPFLNVGAQQLGSVPIDFGKKDIAGVVASSKGPEAGVWVIAETTELPTKFARIVVTDDRGRYLIPDLPKATYDVWVRGYGLVDSRHVRAAAGKTLNLTAVIAPDARAAAQYYPAGYWLSLMQVPEKSEFPGTGANGIAQGMKTQADWLRTMKSGTCLACHALGTKATREIPVALDAMSPTDAWM